MFGETTPAFAARHSRAKKRIHYLVARVSRIREVDKYNMRASYNYTVLLLTTGICASPNSKGTSTDIATLCNCPAQVRPTLRF